MAYQKKGGSFQRYVSHNQMVTIYIIPILVYIIPIISPAPQGDHISYVRGLCGQAETRNKLRLLRQKAHQAQNSGLHLGFLVGGLGADWDKLEIQYMTQLLIDIYSYIKNNEYRYISTNHPRLKLF